MVAIRRLQARSRATENVFNIAFAFILRTTIKHFKSCMGLCGRLQDNQKTIRRMYQSPHHKQHAQQHRRHKRVRSCVRYTQTHASSSTTKRKTTNTRRQAQQQYRETKPAHMCACSLPHMRINVIEHDRTWLVLVVLFGRLTTEIERCPSMPDALFCISCMLKSVNNR